MNPRDLSKATGRLRDTRSALEATGSSRRGFLKDAGALIVGFSMAGGNCRLVAQNPIDPTGLVDATQVDSWISIAADESITAYSGKIEFGQGFSTVQIQLIAEELFVPLSRIKIILGDTGFTPDQGVTSGSQSTVAEFRPVACVRRWTLRAMHCSNWRLSNSMLQRANSRFGMECSR